MRAASRRIGAAIVAALCIPVAFSALAWACSPQPSIAIGAFDGTPRRATTVTGSAFPTGPVKIMWGSASGTQIATAQGPSFAVPVTIPDAEPGVYYIVAISEVDAAYRNSAAVEIEAPAASPQPDPEPAPTSPEGTSAPAAATPAAGAPAATGPTASAAAAPAAAAAATKPAPARTTTPKASAPGRTTGSRRGSQPGGTSSSGRSGAPLAARTGSRPAPVFGGATTGKPEPASAHSDAARKRGDGAPSQATLSFGDASRGFSSPSESALVPSEPGAAAHAGPSRAPLTAGLILLSAGLLALFGSFTVASVRRRRSRSGGAER